MIRTPDVGSVAAKFSVTPRSPETGVLGVRHYMEAPELAAIRFSPGAYRWVARWRRGKQRPALPIPYVGGWHAPGPANSAMPTSPHNRAYMKARLDEEIDRASRYGRAFTLITIEVGPSADGRLIRARADRAVETMSATLRPSDVLARMHDDVVWALLVEANRSGGRDTVFRIRERLARIGGIWRVTSYVFPDDAAAIGQCAAAA